MWRYRWSRLSEFLGQPQSLVLLLLPGLVALSLYFMARDEPDFDRIQYLVTRAYNKSVSEIVDGYLVWSSKCHIPSKSPLDPSIAKFVKREKFEPCSTTPPLTSIMRGSNGTITLVINQNQAKQYKFLSCCWAPIARPNGPLIDLSDKEFDSRISVGPCESFQGQVVLSHHVDLISVVCRNSKSTNLKIKAKPKTKIGKSATGIIYENVHAVVNPMKVRERLIGNAIINTTSVFEKEGVSGVDNNSTVEKRRLSVLMLGIDSVSRLNFHRSMPLTREYLEERGWLELRGYNKMGENTFPNLMAFLTGQNQIDAYEKCKPKVPYALDHCPFIWYDFRDAGYATAYGEDLAKISTFNYLKVGFVDPPVDYYLRPYVIAYEKLLKTKVRFSVKYCAGTELAFDRIFDYAVDFAKTFIGYPSFGFFWTNHVSHENMNGPSSVDFDFMKKLHELEQAGVTNDSMIIILSDHGMRYGDVRATSVGWYEERLPFIYISLPDWFIAQEPDAYNALRINQNRLTSPYDLYETLRDIVIRAGGQPKPSTGCPGCRSLFKPATTERGCSDAGVSSHWCTCTGFEPANLDDDIILEGATKFVEYMENIVKKYKSKWGRRLCARPRLKQILRAERIQDFERSTNSAIDLFYLIHTTPGNGKFEVTMRYHGPGNFTVNDEEVSRITSYDWSARCLSEGPKKYCHCTR
ncbi:hypothetical protein QAD02_011808 [Eretmocerus hayati]|uniref:Uncharacterized protein n=1 Tax=Eretmocerus hayati TaxID=131215 RepID=A0ACC2NY33_9HYME|nr:hypothetical protein QAD02_011808 [Eretmocerus hayati]